MRISSGRATNAQEDAIDGMPEFHHSPCRKRDSLAILVLERSYKSIRTHILRDYIGIVEIYHPDRQASTERKSRTAGV